MWQVSAHVRRIEAVEKDLKALSESSATKEDISRVRAEMKKLYDGLHVGTSPRSIGNCERLLYDLSRIPRPAGACLGHPCVSSWFSVKRTTHIQLAITEEDVHALSKKNGTTVRIV